MIFKIISMEKDRSALHAKWYFDTRLRAWRPEQVGRRDVASQARRAERRCMQENIIATIPQGSADTVLEVALIHDGSQGVHIELRYLAWGTGVGWYRQHTLKLDRSAAQALFRTLGYIRSCLAKLPRDESAEKVIPLSSVDCTQVTTQ